MTTRDDLVSRLNAGCVFQYVGDGSDNQEVDTLATYATMQEAASALEAMGAEIARLNKCYDLAIKSRLEWREQAERLERQLAEETERCARVAEEKYHGHSTAFRTQRARNYEHAGEEIAAAIRGGAK